MSHTMSTVYKS